MKYANSWTGKLWRARVSRSGWGVVLLSCLVFLSGIISKIPAQPPLPRPRHVFTLRGVSDRLSFGTVGDIFFEPRYREIYLTDASRGEVWILDSEGFLLHRFGRSVNLRSPRSVVTFPDGRILVTARIGEKEHRIRLFDPRGHALGFFPSDRSEASSSWSEADAPGVGDYPEWAAQRYKGVDSFAAGADLARLAFASPPRGPEGHLGGALGRMELAPDQLVYVFDGERGRIVVFDREGNLEGVIRGGSSPVGLRGQKKGISASGLAIRPGGTVLATDLTRGVVVEYDREGDEVRTIGRRGGMEGLLSFPVDLALDLDENLYVVDRHRHTILVYDREGRFQYEFGGLGLRDGFFFYPSSICVDDVNRLWIVDGSNRVQVFQVPQNGNGLNGKWTNGYSSYNGRHQGLRNGRMAYGVKGTVPENK